jgi:hypothetical protein
LCSGHPEEKATVFRTAKRRNPITGVTYPWIVKTIAMVNHFYIYAVDSDFGPFFIKFCSYYPCNAKLCINGNEWAKRQAAKAGIGFQALDNGFASCEHPARLQRICDRLDAARIDRLAGKWLKLLPHPFAVSDRRAGYRYDLSILQAEFSLTRMLDRPASGRVFFETVIRENLDVGRPDRVSLVFDGRIFNAADTPPRDGSAPGSSPRASPPACTPTTSTPASSSTTRRDELFAPRPPSTTPVTFRSANGCATCPPCGRSASLPTGAAFTPKGSATTRSSGTPSSPTSPNPRSSTVSASPGCASPTQGSMPSPAASSSRSQPAGFSNRDLRHQLAQLTGTASITPGATTYDLRRLRLHGLIERLPLPPTPLVWRTAWLYTHAYNRYLRTATADIADPASTSPLQQALDDLAHRSGLPA